MDPDRRRVYRRIGWAFVGVGAVFLLIDAVQATFGLELLNGSPAGVALLVILIGAALAWTAREPRDP